MCIQTYLVVASVVYTSSPWCESCEACLHCSSPLHPPRQVPPVSQEMNSTRGPFTAFPPTLAGAKPDCGPGSVDACVPGSSLAHCFTPHTCGISPGMSHARGVGNGDCLQLVHGWATTLACVCPHLCSAPLTDGAESRGQATPPLSSTQHMSSSVTKHRCACAQSRRGDRALLPGFRQTG